MKLQGVASGSFDLDVHEVSGNTITASSTFAVIPSATSTKASISFHRGGIDTASPLTIDFHGDGKHEEGERNTERGVEDEVRVNEQTGAAVEEATSSLKEQLN